MLGTAIRTIRTEKCISLQDLAVAADMHPGSLTNIEKGYRNPSIGALNKIATALGVPPSDLFQKERSGNVNEITELGIKQEGNKIVVSSRIVAENFEKRHDNVLADIKNVLSTLTPKILGIRKMENYFIQSTYVNERGREYPEYFLTKDGFTLLTMGYTGEKAMRFKIAYINEFNRMENTLKSIFKPVSELTPPEITDRTFQAYKNITLTIAQELGVKKGIAVAKAIEMTEDETGKNLSKAKELLPPAEHTTGFLTPTKIGKMLNPNQSAIKTNKLLEAELLQTKIDGDWRLTDMGKDYGEEFPFTRNGHSGYQIRWNETVLEILTRGGRQCVTG